jgi:hypothetical protein
MSLRASLAGRLRNMPLKPTHALLPLFEAVVNSIHAISDAGLTETNGGAISVRILREGSTTQTVLGDDNSSPKGKALEHIVGFEITDNGIGFTGMCQ